MSKREKPVVGGDMVAVMRSEDPVRVRQVVELLEDNGIVCATPGLEHRSMLNFFGPYVQITVLVGEAEAKRARGILRSLEVGVPVEEETEPAEPDPKATYRRAARKRAEEADEDELPRGDVRLRRVAALAALVFPSGAHLYARKYLAASIVLALYFVALFTGPENTPFRVIAILSVTAIDIAGACHWADVSQGRTARGPWRFAVPFGVVAVPVLLFGLAHPLAALFAGPHGRAYCDVVGQCGGDRDACMRQESELRGGEGAMTSRCAECAERSGCDLEECHRECDL